MEFKEIILHPSASYTFSSPRPTPTAKTMVSNNGGWKGNCLISWYAHSSVRKSHGWFEHPTLEQSTRSLICPKLFYLICKISWPNCILLTRRALLPEKGTVREAGCSSLCLYLPPSKQEVTIPGKAASAQASSCQIFRERDILNKK